MKPYTTPRLTRHSWRQGYAGWQLFDLLRSPWYRWSFVPGEVWPDA